MKKILLFTIAVFSMASCRSDSDDSNNLKNGIVGKWFYSKRVFVSGANGSILTTESANDCEKKSFFEFTNDKVTEYDYQLNSNQCILDYSATSIYHIDNNILYYEDNASIKIESINNSELVFQVDLYDVNGDGQKDKILEYYNK